MRKLGKFSVRRRENFILSESRKRMQYKFLKYKKSKYTVFGKIYDTILCHTIDDANDFMNKNSNYGVISYGDDTNIHMALISEVK